MVDRKLNINKVAPAYTRTNSLASTSPDRSISIERKKIELEEMADVFKERRSLSKTSKQDSVTNSPADNGISPYKSIYAQDPKRINRMASKGSLKNKSKDLKLATFKKSVTIFDENASDPSSAYDMINVNISK